MIATHDSHELSELDPLTTRNPSLRSLGLPSHIVREYFESLPVTLEQIHRALEQEDYFEVKLLSHRLAGSCGMFGLTTLGTTMAAISHAAEQTCRQAIVEHLYAASTLCLQATPERHYQ